MLDNNVVYRKRLYESLSEVARVITGTRWSGPLFFGLTRRDREAAMANTPISSGAVT